MTYAENVALIVLAMIVYRFTYARNDVICMILLGVILISYKMFVHFQVNIMKWKIMKVLPYIMPMFAVLMIALSQIYTERVGVLYKLNSLLSGRLSIGNHGLDEYGISMLGQSVYERGNGFGTIRSANNPYFFLDSSYLRIFIIDGVLMFFVILIIYVFIVKKLINEKHLIGVIVILIVAVSSFVEHHLLELFYNPMTLLLFAEIPSLEKERTYVGENTNE